MFGATRVIAEAVASGFTECDGTTVVRASKAGGSVLYDATLSSSEARRTSGACPGPAPGKVNRVMPKMHGGDLALELGADDSRTPGASVDKNGRLMPLEALPPRAAGPLSRFGVHRPIDTNRQRAI